MGFLGTTFFALQLLREISADLVSRWKLGQFLATLNWKDFWIIVKILKYSFFWKTGSRQMKISFLLCFSLNFIYILVIWNHFNAWKYYLSYTKNFDCSSVTLALHCETQIYIWVFIRCWETMNLIQSNRRKKHEFASFILFVYLDLLVLTELFEFNILFDFFSETFDPSVNYKTRNNSNYISLNEYILQKYF